MNQPGRPMQKKNTKISLRTQETTLTKLRIISRIEGKTISSLIENVLTEHVLQPENPLPLSEEKRSSPRKKCSIPVVISLANNTAPTYCNGVIVNFSPFAMQIILSDQASGHLQLGAELHALFTLPTSAMPLLLSGVVSRIDHAPGECMITSGIRGSERHELDCINKFVRDKAPSKSGTGHLVYS